MKKGILLKRILIVTVILGVFSFGFVALYIAKDRSFDDMPSLPKRSVPENWSAHIKIGIIGDSWVTGEKLDQFVEEPLLTLGIPTEVVSSGQPGAKSRQIYRNLLADKSQPYSSHKLLMDEDLDYLVVIAGVNDTASHIGRDFYAHHMLCIIKAIQDRGIHPVIVEVPEFGIENAPAHNFLSLPKRLIYRTVFDGMQHDVISDYREELRGQNSRSLKDELTLVSFDFLVQDYSSKVHLYANPIHLNIEGLQLFGALIADNIANAHNKRLKNSVNHNHQFWHTTSK